MGLAVGKKVGTAVTRNRVKRRLRAAARARLPRMRPGHDVVLIARPDTAGAPFDELCGALDLLLERAGLLRAEDTAR